MTSAIVPPSGRIIVASWRNETFDACGNPPPPTEGADAEPPLPALLEGALGLQAATANIDTNAKAATRMGRLLKTPPA
jgi:hypothetical protein